MKKVYSVYVTLFQVNQRLVYEYLPHGEICKIIKQYYYKQHRDW